MKSASPPQAHGPTASTSVAAVRAATAQQQHLLENTAATTAVAAAFTFDSTSSHGGLAVGTTLHAIGGPFGTMLGSPLSAKTGRWVCKFRVEECVGNCAFFGVVPVNWN